MSVAQEVAGGLRMLAVQADGQGISDIPVEDRPISLTLVDDLRIMPVVRVMDGR